MHEFGRGGMMKYAITTVGILLGVLACAKLGVGAADADDSCDTARGKRVFQQCQICHSLKPDGTHGLAGPNLYGVVDRTAGSAEGFRFSKAMRESSLVWSRENLIEFLTSPRDTVPGTSMAFGGLRNREDVDAVVCLLAAESS